MVFHGHLAVGALHLVVGGGAVDAEHLVGVFGVGGPAAARRGAAAVAAAVGGTHVALVDGGVVGLRDAEILCYEAQHVELALVELAVGAADAEEEVDHVVARSVVGVDLDLHAHLVDGDVPVDHLLQHFEHLLAAHFAVVGEEEPLDEDELAALDVAVDLHDGGNEYHQRGVDVGLRARVVVRAAVGSVVGAEGAAAELPVGRDGLAERAFSRAWACVGVDAQRGCAQTNNANKKIIISLLKKKKGGG